MASQPEPAQLVEAMDEYLEAVRSIDGPMPSLGAADEDLDLVAAGVAPLPLPEALRTMWKRFQDPQLMPYPEWGTALERLESWRRERDEAAVALPVLFPIGSFGFALLLCADLTAPPELGVPLWEHEYVDGEARLRHRSLAAYYRAAAEAVRTGLVEWSFGRAAIADQRAWDEVTSRWNEEFAAHDDLGVEVVDTNSPLAWPHRWQVAAGVDIELARPRGATTTIATLIAGRAVQQPATIVGRIIGLAGSHESRRVQFRDSTGEIAVWIAGRADPFSVGVMRAEVELDVMLLPSVGRGEAASDQLGAWQGRVQHAALGGDLAGAQAAAVEFAKLLGPGSADAIAIAVRPASTA